MVILNVRFSVFSNTYFNTILSRADSCFWFFNEMNDIYRTRGLEIVYNFISSEDLSTN
jgi:hypothetical protein